VFVWIIGTSLLLDYSNVYSEWPDLFPIKIVLKEGEGDLNSLHG